MGDKETLLIRFQCYTLKDIMSQEILRHTEPEHGARPIKADPPEELLVRAKADDEHNPPCHICDCPEWNDNGGDGLCDTIVYVDGDDDPAYLCGHPIESHY